MKASASIPTIATIGIDIGKNTFHLIGLDGRGAIVLRQKLSRGLDIRPLVFGLVPFRLPY